VVKTFFANLLALIFITNETKIFEALLIVIRSVNINAFVISLHIEYERFVAPAPSCSGARPVCQTCLYASSAQRCIIEGYEDDCSAMTDVSLLARPEIDSSVFDHLFYCKLVTVHYNF